MFWNAFADPSCDRRFAKELYSKCYINIFRQETFAFLNLFIENIYNTNAYH